MNLYHSYEVDEETPVQFAGVYVTRWRPEWGEPTILFREVEEDELDALATKSEKVQALVEAARDDSDEPGKQVVPDLRELADKLERADWPDWPEFLRGTADRLEKALAPFEEPASTETRE